MAMKKCYIGIVILLRFIFYSVQIYFLDRRMRAFAVFFFNSSSSHVIINAPHRRITYTFHKKNQFGQFIYSVRLVNRSCKFFKCKTATAAQPISAFARLSCAWNGRRESSRDIVIDAIIYGEAACQFRSLILYLHIYFNLMQ